MRKVPFTHTPAQLDSESGVRLARPTRPVNGVRLADKLDAEQVALIHAVSWQVASEQQVVSTCPKPSDLHLQAGRWARRFERGALPTLLAIENGDIAGYAALGPARDGSEGKAVIDSAHVRPERWRGRTTNTLLTATGHWLSRHGFRELGMSVLSENAWVQQLLTQRGFRMAGYVMSCGRLCTTYGKSLTDLDWSYVVS